MDLKKHVISFMELKGITPKSLSESNNIPEDEIKAYLAMDNWQPIISQFFFNELGKDFQAYLLK